MRPKIEWPDGKKICATFTVAFEAFTRGGHFKKAKGLEVNLVSLSHANYGGNAGIWRILEILERNKARATVDVNGLAVQNGRTPSRRCTQPEMRSPGTAPPTTSR
jgi:hypothetical protein